MTTSLTTRYALRATILLARHDPNEPVRVSEIAEALGAPRNYLSKILHVMARAGLLHSTRGPTGGFRLAVDPAELPLVRVVSLFEPVYERRACVLGRDQCSDANPCGAHERWKRVAEPLMAFFATTTVADVLAPAARSARRRPAKRPGAEPARKRVRKRKGAQA